MKCKDCQNYKEYYKSCETKKCHVNPEDERNCSEAKAIESRELWIAREQWGSLKIYLTKPHYDGKWGRENWSAGFDAPMFPYNGRVMSLPSYLYPEITFENSPQRLTLMSDEK